VTGAVRLGRRPLALGLAVLLLACGPPAPREMDAPAAAKAEPAPLAEARLPDSPLAVRITGVARSGPEVLEVAFALVNPGAVSAAPPPGPGTRPGGEEWLAAAYLIDEARGKRFYVMRDAEGRPKCTAAMAQIGPGGRQAMSARFPAPGGEAGRITVVVPGVAPFRGIAFPGTGASGQSY